MFQKMISWLQRKWELMEIMVFTWAILPLTNNKKVAINNMAKKNTNKNNTLSNVLSKRGTFWFDKNKSRWVVSLSVNGQRWRKTFTSRTAAKNGLMQMRNEIATFANVVERRS